MYSKVNKLITELNLAKIRRTNSFRIRYNRSILLFLGKLCEYGFLRGFHIEENSYFVTVFLKYVNNKTNFNKIYYIKGKRSVSLISLMKMSNRIKPCLYLLSTSKGLLFHDECFLLKVSGIVIAKIYV